MVLYICELNFLCETENYCSFTEYCFEKTIVRSLQTFSFHGSAGFNQIAVRVDLADRIRPAMQKITGTAREVTIKMENNQTKEPKISN